MNRRRFYLRFSHFARVFIFRPVGLGGIIGRDISIEIAQFPLVDISLHLKAEANVYVYTYKF